jgi:ATP-dependent Clp protease adapter protein ClpS
MNRKHWLAMAAACFLLSTTACVWIFGNDKNNPEKPFELKGQWKLEAVRFAGSDTNQLSATNALVLLLSQDSATGTIQFKNDGQYLAIVNKDTSLGKFSLDSLQQTLSFPGDSTNLTMQVKPKGDSLVELLTKDSLQFKLSKIQ